MSIATLNLVPKVSEMGSHLATSYHVLSQLITFYAPSLLEK